MEIKHVDHERVDLWRRVSLREFVDRHISHNHADHGRHVDYERIDAWQRGDLVVYRNGPPPQTQTEYERQELRKENEARRKREDREHLSKIVRESCIAFFAVAVISIALYHTGRIIVETNVSSVSSPAKPLAIAFWFIVIIAISGYLVARWERR
jgi:hypothetical protein